MPKNSQDVGSNVEACLAQSWSFLSGEPVSFEPVAEPATLSDETIYWWVGLNPRGAIWSAGLILGLKGDNIFASADYASELCNIFAGCLTRLYENRDGFSAGLPRSLTAAEVREMKAKVTRLNCYRNQTGTALVLAYYADLSIEPVQ